MSRIFYKLLEPINDDPNKFTKYDALAMGIGLSACMCIIGLACIIHLVTRF